MLLIIKEDVFINLIGNRNGIPFVAQIGNSLKLYAGEHLSRWIIGSVYDYCLGAVVERRRKFIRIKSPVRRVQRHISWSRPGQDRIGTVVLIKRFEDYNLVAGIHDC